MNCGLISPRHLGSQQPRQYGLYFRPESAKAVRLSPLDGGRFSHLADSLDDIDGTARPDDARLATLVWSFVGTTWPSTTGQAIRFHSGAD